MTFVAAIAGAWLLVTGLLFGFQRALLYLPDTRPVEPARMRAAGLAPVPVHVDGLELTAWMRAPQGGRTLTAVLFHGNGGHLGWRLFAVEPLLRDGWGIVLAPYPGYGGAPGSPSERAFYAAGRAMLDALAARGLPSERLVLWGESLGSGVATKLATERRVAGVILQAPFTSVPDRAQEIYPFVPAHLLARDRYDNLSRIADIGAPLLIVHGERDRVVPVAHAKRLIEAARAPKRAVVIRDADHNDLFDHDLIVHIRAFLEELEAKRG